MFLFLAWVGIQCKFSISLCICHVSDVLANSIISILTGATSCLTELLWFEAWLLTFFFIFGLCSPIPRAKNGSLKVSQSKFGYLHRIYRHRKRTQQKMCLKIQIFNVFIFIAILHFPHHLFSFLVIFVLTKKLINFLVFHTLTHPRPLNYFLRPHRHTRFFSFPFIVIIIFVLIDDHVLCFSRIFFSFARSLSLYRRHSSAILFSK